MLCQRCGVYCGGIKKYSGLKSRGICLFSLDFLELYKNLQKKCKKGIDIEGGG
jgi:hypothetical protein